ALQHQYHRRFPPDAPRRWPGTEHRLCIPARWPGVPATENSPDAERGLLVEYRGRRSPDRHPDRLWPDRRADLLRRRVSRAGATPCRPGRADTVRAVLHRRTPELLARALLLPGARRGKPVL